MIVPLAYGRTGLDLSVPDDLADRGDGHRAALRTRPPGRSGCNACCAPQTGRDTAPARPARANGYGSGRLLRHHTRPMPSDRVLPVLLEEVETVVRPATALCSSTGQVPTAPTPRTSYAKCSAQIWSHNIALCSTTPATTTI